MLTVLLRTLGALGIGLLLAAAPLFLARGRRVTPDPTVEKILGELSGANCGLCGWESCLNAAKRMARGKSPADTCVSGGQATAAAVQRILDERS